MWGFFFLRAVEVGAGVRDAIAVCREDITMPEIAYLNSPFGDPEVHAPGCADIKKKVRRGFDLAGYAEVTTHREARGTP